MCNFFRRNNPVYNILSTVNFDAFLCNAFVLNNTQVPIYYLTIRQSTGKHYPLFKPIHSNPTRLAVHYNNYFFPFGARHSVMQNRYNLGESVRHI